MSRVHVTFSPGGDPYNIAASQGVEQNGVFIWDKGRIRQCHVTVDLPPCTVTYASFKAIGGTASEARLRIGGTQCGYEAPFGGTKTIDCSNIYTNVTSVYCENRVALWKSRIDDVIIEFEPNELPVADFSVADGNSIGEFDFTNFSHDGTPGSDKYLTEYLWNFGDGNTSSEKDASHVFGYGVHRVTLTVTQLGGAQAAKSMLIVVAQPEPNHEGKDFCPICFIASDKTDTQSPISLRQGEKREAVTDLSLITPGEALIFTRFYRQSQHDDLQFMGLGWNHNHAISLDTNVSGKLLVRMPNGGVAHFTQDTANTNLYPGDPGSNSSITYNTTTTEYTLTASDQSTYVFDSAGKLLSRTWPNNETWTFSYFSSGNAIGLLQEVADTYGNKLQFAYVNNVGAFDDLQLWRVGDHTVPAFGQTNDLESATPTGRYVEFDYVESKQEDSGNPGTIIAGGKALLSTIKTVRGDIWTYNYIEDDLDVLNYMHQQITPLVDTTGDHIANARITAKEMDYSLTRELAINGDMESDSDWEPISNATNNQSSIQVDTGSNSWYVNATQNDGIEGNTWNLVTGRSYAITARVYPVSGIVKMGVSGTSSFDQNSTGTDAWETLAATYTPTADSSNVKLQFSANGTDAEFYVDSVSIEETSTQLSTIVQRLGQEDASSFLQQRDYVFQPSGNNTTLEIVDGKVTTHYFAGGVYAGPSDPAGNASFQALNDQYRPQDQADANGNVTQMGWSSDGKRLESVTDAASNSTSFTYDVEDRLISSVDAEGRKTVYTYDDVANPDLRQPTRIQVYEYDGGPLLSQQEYTYDNKGRMTDERKIDTDGTTILRQTTRSYYTSGNGNGLLETLTEDAHLSSAEQRKTTYIYDSAGRVIRVNRNSLFGTCQYTYTVYDAAGNVLGTACSQHSATTNPTSTADLRAIYTAEPDSTTVTLHEYDALGRRVKTITQAESSLEKIVLTFYDALNRVRLQINNFVGSGSDLPGLWEWRAVNSVWGWYHSDDTPVDQGETHDQNTITAMSYNARGLVQQQRDSLGIVTYTVYDDADRPIRQIANYVPQGSSNPADWVYETGEWKQATGGASIDHGTRNDQNLITETGYDANGNPVKSIGLDRNVTLTGYDALNRVVKTIRAASNPDYDYTIDRTLANYTPSSAVDADRISTTAYDALGRVLSQTDESGQTTRMVYDALGRQRLAIRNYMPQGSSNPADWVYETNQWKQAPSGTVIVHGEKNDQNIITETVYDAEGRPQQTLITQDGDQICTYTLYDAKGRSVGTVQNYVAQGTSDPVDWVFENGSWKQSTGSAAIDHGSHHDQNIIERRYYNADDQVEKTINSVGQWTRNVFDARGRLVRVITNASDPDTATPLSDVPVDDPDMDHITDTTYDVFGRMIATHQLVETRGGSDIWSTTLYGYDSVGRQIKSIAQASTPNYNGDQLIDPDLSDYTLSDDPDQDLVTETIYNASGRVLYTRDPSSVHTWTAYDRLGRGYRTITNPLTVAQDGSTTDPRSDTYVPSSDGDVDVIRTTLFGSDGRLLQSVDPLGRVTRPVYDGLGRTVRTVRNYAETTDPALWTLDGQVWKDGAGDPIPRGSNADLNLVTDTIYDAQGRVQQTQDARGNRTYSVYDGLGRQRLTIRNYVPQGSSDPADWVFESGAWKQTSGGTDIQHGADNTDNLITATAYDLAGRMLSTRDPQGRLTRFVYDALGRRRLTIRNYVPQGSSAPEDWIFEDGLWKQASSGTAIQHGADNTDNLIAQTTYDLAGRVVSSMDPRGTVTALSYDGVGRRLTITHDTGGNLETTTYTCYDKAGRVLRTIGAYVPIPAAASLPADAQDINGNIHPDAQDGAGNWYFNPAATDPADVNLVTTYAYDRAHRRVQSADPVGAVTTTAYSPDGQVDTLTDPEQMATVFRYDGLRRRRLVVQGYEDIGSDPADWVWDATDDQWEVN